MIFFFLEKLYFASSTWSHLSMYSFSHLSFLLIWAILAFMKRMGDKGFFFLHFALSCLLLFQGHYLPSVKKILFIYLFIYFWLCWVFSAGHRLSLVAENNPSLQCTGFTLWYVCYCGAQAQVYGLSSCGGT